MILAIVTVVLFCAGYIGGVLLYYKVKDRRRAGQRAYRFDTQVAAIERWVPVAGSGDVELEHLDGVPWYKAPLPPRIHSCTPQTRGWSGFQRIKRCACGGTWIMDGWCGKNERTRA